MKALVLGALLFAGALFLSNPDASEHRDAVQDASFEILELSREETIFEALGTQAAKELLEVDNLVFFSVGKIPFFGFEVPVSVGFLTKVFPFYSIVNPKTLFFMSWIGFIFVVSTWYFWRKSRRLKKELDKRGV